MKTACRIGAIVPDLTVGKLTVVVRAIIRITPAERPAVIVPVDIPVKIVITMTPADDGAVNFAAPGIAAPGNCCDRDRRRGPRPPAAAVTVRGRSVAGKGPMRRATQP
jgi:hypothetical protein